MYRLLESKEELRPGDEYYLGNKWILIPETWYGAIYDLGSDNTIARQNIPFRRKMEEGGIVKIRKGTKVLGMHGIGIVTKGIIGSCHDVCVEYEDGMIALHCQMPGCYEYEPVYELPKKL